MGSRSASISDISKHSEGPPAAEQDVLSDLSDLSEVQDPPVNPEEREEHQAPESSSSADLSKSFVEGATVSYSDRFVAHNRRVTFEDQNLQDVCYSSNGENNVSNALIIDESFAPNFSPDEM